MRSCVVCRRPTWGDYCEAHDPQKDLERMQRQPWRKEYRDPEYLRNRQRRYELAGGRCEDCGLQVAVGEFECDHELALSRGGTHAIENLRIRCIVPRAGASRGCHGLKTRADRRS